MKTKKTKAIFIESVTITDPDSFGDVIVEIYKDPVSGGIFGVDASFIEQVDYVIPSPFNENHKLSLME